MPSSKQSRSAGRMRGRRSKNGAKGKTLLLAAVCVSLTPSTSAFTVGPIRGPAHVTSTSSSTQSGSSALATSPNDDDYFFTAPPQSEDNNDDDDNVDVETNVMTSSDSGMISAEQTELETMEIAEDEDEEEDLLSTSSVVASISSTPSPSPAPTLSMNVDGNGTGALMKRSPAAGGVNPALMATNPYLAYPIDSGKDGMQAHDTRVRTRTPATPPNNGAVDVGQPKTRLVRYSLPTTDPLEPKQTPPPGKKLVLAPVTNKNAMNSELARPQKSQVKPSQPRLVRYNGPDVEHSTDYDGMELSSVKKKRNRELNLKRSNLVRYNGASQQEQMTQQDPEEDEIEKDGTDDDHQKGRKTLVEDLGYANRYTGPSDFNLAKKTGLTVNKPTSLWVERDKFL